MANRNSPYNNNNDDESGTLHHLFQSLHLAVKKKNFDDDGGSKQRAESLQRGLDQSDFVIFKVVCDLGYWGWTPHGGNYKALQTVTAKEIMDQLHVDKTPDELVSLSLVLPRLPKPFLSLPPREHVHKYPYAAPVLAALHVAVHHRGVNLSQDVDIVFFGGSILDLFSTQSLELNEDGAQYLVCRVPMHPRILVVTRVQEYVKDYSHFGFQFERLMTGKEFHHDHDRCQVRHLQILQIGKYRTLISAEVDAVHQNGQGVEIKASNPYFWGTSTMCQMISNGSTLLCFGDKTRGNSNRSASWPLQQQPQQYQLRHVELRTLRQVVVEALSSTTTTPRRACDLERTILKGIEMLRKEATAKLQEGKVMELYFEAKGPTNVLKLRPMVGKGLLPLDRTNQELLLRV